MPKRRHTDSTDSAESNDNISTPTSSAFNYTPLRSTSNKRVSFDDVTLYYFQRSQGFTCVPSVGGTTLGMTGSHLAIEKLPLTVFESKERKEIDRTRRLAVIDSGQAGTSNNEDEHEAEEGEGEEEESDQDDEGDVQDDDDVLCLQPLATRDRRAMLRAAGIDVDHSERDDCDSIRESRQTCGCQCINVCVPESCQCAINNIKCQVDRPSFPCACTRQGCQNPIGRVEFNPFRVRSHFMHTMMRIKSEERLGGEEVRASPRQHIRFDNDDSYCDNNSTPINNDTPIPSLTSIFQDGQFHHGYGLARYPSFNLDQSQSSNQNTTYQISSLYQHVNPRPQNVQNTEQVHDPEETNKLEHEPKSTAVA